MKKGCGIVQDLLPLYAEKMTNDESNDMIEEHLRDCMECREKLERMREELPTVEGQGEAALRSIKNKLFWRKIGIVLGTIAVCVFLLILGLKILSRPINLEYSEDLISFSQIDDNVYIHLGKDVKGWIIEGEMSEDDPEEWDFYVSIWTTHLDQWFGKEEEHTWLLNEPSPAYAVGQGGDLPIVEEHRNRVTKVYYVPRVQGFESFETWKETGLVIFESVN